MVLTHGIAEVMGLCSVPSMRVDRTDQLDKGSDGFQIDVLFYLSQFSHTHTHTHTHTRVHTHTHSIAGDGPSVRDSEFPLRK